MNTLKKYLTYTAIGIMPWFSMKEEFTNVQNLTKLSKVDLSKVQALLDKIKNIQDEISTGA